MSYFGQFKGHGLGSMDEDERNNFLVEEGLFQQVYRITLNNGVNQVYPLDTPPIPQPTKQLMDDLYGFLLDRFIESITTPYYAFYLDFEDEIFGLDKESEKKVALGYFKVFSDQILTRTVRFFNTTRDNNGIERVKGLAKMEVLLGQQEAIKNNLANSFLLIPFLEGNNVYFDRVNASTNEEFTRFIEFETVFKIVVSLNEIYGFEKDYKSDNTEAVKSTFETTQKSSNKINTSSLTNQQKKNRPITDQQAIDYLINNVFTKSKSK
ncbi:hypothetical protein [Flagellimonas myxillae]|uniref:hypothetical protein n=1 Tax=Flagellimonas myxillae TaxID=2942214 RepID=UPI00201F8869|nr:hypothetical protein [Muricauda myxillae]MCL6267785.1 hypothetical protein [Muricauda myxillae]